MPDTDPIRAAMDAAFLADQHRFVEEFARAHPESPRPVRTERPDPRVDGCDDCAWEPDGEPCSFHADAVTTTTAEPEMPARIRPHAFRVVWTAADHPGAVSTPLTVLGDTLTHADARAVVAAAASSSAVTVLDVVPLGPVRALHPDTVRIECTGCSAALVVDAAHADDATPHDVHNVVGRARMDYAGHQLRRV